jgi:hypothetical protein
MELVITEIEPHMQSEEVQSEEREKEEKQEKQEKQEMREMQSGPEEALNALNTILEATPTFDDFCEPCEKKPQKVVEPQVTPNAAAAMPRTRGSSKAALGPSVEVRIKRGDVFPQVRQKNRAVIQPKHEFLGRMMSGRSHRLVGGMPMRMRVGT